MLAVGRPHRDALLSPLPRGISPWGTLNSPTSLQSMQQAIILDTNVEEDDFRSSSSRAGTPTTFTYTQRRRLFTRSTGSAGGVLLVDPTRTSSPMMKSRARDDSATNSFIALDSQLAESHTSSPPLNRKRGDVSTLKSPLSRPQSGLSQKSTTKAEERIRSVAELESLKLTSPRGSYQMPAVQSVDDVFFTGVATPEPPAANTVEALLGGGGGLDGFLRSVRARKQALATPKEATELSYRNPSPIFEDKDTPECYTPTPGPKGSRNVHPMSSKYQQAPKDSMATTSEKDTSKDKLEAAGPSSKSNNYFHLKYPTTHSATIEIRHTEGIKISGGGKNGGAKIDIQVDIDNAHAYGYTSTIRTGKKGGMTVTVRPTSANSFRNPVAGGTTTTTVKDQAVDENNLEPGEVIHHFAEGEDEVVIAPTTRRRKSRSKHRSSVHKSHHHHNGIETGAGLPSEHLPYPQTPPPQQSRSASQQQDAISRHQSLAESVNLIDLHSGTPAPSSSGVSTPRRIVRKMDRIADLKIKEMESPVLPRSSGHGPRDIFERLEEEEQARAQETHDANADAELEVQQQQQQLLQEEEDEDGFEWDEPETPPFPHMQQQFHHHQHYQYIPPQHSHHSNNDEFDGGPVILGGRKNSNSATTAILIRKRESVQSGKSGKSGSGGSRNSRGSRDIGASGGKEVRPLSFVGLPLDFASSMGVKDVEEIEEGLQHEEDVQLQQQQQQQQQHQQIAGLQEIEGGWI